MNAVAEPTSEITQAEIVTNVSYGYWFNHLCDRAYGRIDVALNVVQLVGGSGAVIAALQGAPVWSAVTGVALAAAAAFALLIQPSVKAERHRRAKCEYLALKDRAWKLSADQLSAELTKIQIDAPNGFESLSAPAYNATLKAIGVSSGQLPETRLSRLMRAFA